MKKVKVKENGLILTKTYTWEYLRGADCRGLLFDIVRLNPAGKGEQNDMLIQFFARISTTRVFFSERYTLANECGEDPVAVLFFKIVLFPGCWKLSVCKTERTQTNEKNSLSAASRLETGRLAILSVFCPTGVESIPAAAFNQIIS